LPPEAAAFLDYWFGAQTPEQWWKRDPAVDEALRTRFGALHERLANEVPEDWLKTPRGTLAAVMVLDQLPRNLFRGSPRAYATDPKALALAKQGVARGLDASLSKDERTFLYVPFQHSEDAADQAQSVALFERLDDAEALDFAHKHKDIIDRFGRFPHRNTVLGRETTPEEAEFLKGPALFW
jgi:uncharacterized protein (DUF924 family)